MVRTAFVLLVVILVGFLGFHFLNTHPAQAAWIPPIGIPMPSFGINETAPTYSSTSSLHYYVNGSVACNDSNNGGRGSPSAPRCTIPGDQGAPLAAGSLIEVRGIYNVRHSSPKDLWGAGTVSAPIFIRGESATNKTQFTDEFAVTGSRYIILENIHFKDQDNNLSGGPTGKFLVSDKNGVRYDSDHIVLRHSEVQGNLLGGGIGIGGYAAATVISNVVIWDVNIHDNGDVNATFDQDVHGMGIGRANYMWIIDSKLERNSGDGIQINGNPDYSTHHIFIGRNEMQGNKQAGVGVKTVADIIISQNKTHGHRASNSTPAGPGFGTQYDFRRLWVLFNEIYDNDNGMVVLSQNSGGRQDLYIIGNVFHNNRSSGLQMNQGVDAPYDYVVANNTFYNNPKGIDNAYYGFTAKFINNLIAGAGTAHINLLDEYGSGGRSDIPNGFFDSPVRIKWDTSTFRDITGMQSVGECGACVAGSPLFVSPSGTIPDLHLQSGSSARDLGSTVSTAPNYSTSAQTRFQALYGLNIAVDFDGNPRPSVLSAWDLGAFEYNSTSTPVPTPTPTPTPSPTPISKQGDIDRDGDIDIFDYNRLVSRFGQTGSAGWISEDIDSNGVINIFDYNLLVMNFGK